MEAQRSDQEDMMQNQGGRDARDIDIANVSRAETPPLGARHGTRRVHVHEEDHEQLAELVSSFAAAHGRPGTGDSLVRYELFDLLDRHYLRICRALGSTTNPQVERSLHELRVAHDWVRHADSPEEIEAIVDRHIAQCPLMLEAERSCPASDPTPR